MPETKKIKASAIKNWLILGAVGVGGWYAYKKWVAPEIKEIKADVKSAAKGSASPAQPDLNGPVVTLGMIARTQTKNCVSKPDSRFTYAPITSFIGGYNTFSSTTNGHFTRRMLCIGNKRWAELKAGI